MTLLPISTVGARIRVRARHTSYMERSVISVMRQLVADLEVYMSDLSGKPGDRIADSLRPPNDLSFKSRLILLETKACG
jgi:hypothetical protein